MPVEDKKTAEIITNPRYVDCLIIGGGPAGLTAGLYLARYRRQAIIIDGGQSRASLIPVSHNLPGFPEGVTGPGLLQRLRAQLAHYQVPILAGIAVHLEKQQDIFTATIGTREIQADRVLLATGIADLGVESGIWNQAIQNGAIRLCPVCDGFETINRKVAILACGRLAVKHALFMRTYTSNLTLVCTDADTMMDEAERATLAAAGIVLIEDPAPEISIADKGIAIVRTSKGIDFSFDSVYPMFGAHPRSDLATALGARCDDDGNLLVDEHQQTSIPGLYAAGDVVSGLNQITVAAGQAAVAATAIHNQLERRFL